MRSFKNMRLRFVIKTGVDSTATPFLGEVCKRKVVLGV